MSLRLVYGRAGSGKSRFCLEDIKVKLNSGYSAPLILVVPEQFSLQAEKGLVRVVGSGGIMQAEVLSFRRMAYRVFNEVGGITRQHINSAGKCMLVYRIMDSLKEDLKVFSKAVRQQGFVNTLVETIAELKRYNITPERLREIADNVDENGFLKEKLVEIYTIYAAFEEKLHERYMDTEDELTELSEKLYRSAQLEGAEIWIDEFSGFTPQEYKVIAGLLKKARRVNISLCTDALPKGAGIDSGEVFSPVRNTAGKLMRIARENHVEIEMPVMIQPGSKGGPSSGPNPDRFMESPEIRHLERSLFSFPYKTYPEKTKDISIFSAVNGYSEVEDTARDIISLCRDRGVRFKDIAVVSRNLAGYERIIRAVFTGYGIPFFIDRKREVKTHPLVVFVLSALEIFINQWSYESVFGYLKTGFANIDRESIDILENYVLACGIRGSRWTQPEDWEYRINPAYEENGPTEYELKILSRVNEIRRKVIRPLTDLRTKTREKRKTKEICSAVFEFLCEIGAHEKIEGFIDEFKQNGELALANEYGQVWNIMMEVLDQVVEVIGDESMGMERFRQVLEIGLGEYRIGLIPPALDQVLVGSVERSKSHEISALYILGVNDGIFPAASEGEGILSDRDRDILNSMGLELAQDTRTKAFEEQFLIYTTLTTSGKYLRLSYPIADHEGRTLRPSMIISLLKKLFPKIYESSNITATDTEEDNLARVSMPLPTFNELVAAARRQVEGSRVNPLWRDVFNWFNENEDWKEKCSTAISGLSYSNRAGAIQIEKVRKLYGSPMHTSISRLESFAACPFSYFVQYGLKARERRIFQLNPPDIGTFIHKVIDRFSGKLAEKDMTWRGLTREFCSNEVSAVVDDLLEQWSWSVFNSSNRYRYLCGRLKRVLTRAVWLIAEHIKRSGFEPVGYEIAFGDGERFPPISIELPGGETVKLTGRVDRVDTLKTDEGDYLRIIDYKSGNKAFRLSDVYYGLQIQLLTYMDAMLGDTYLPGGILYFKVDDPIVKAGGGATEEDIERAIMKQLKMKGLLLADVKLVKEMDRQMEGDSLIIPARINKGDVLGRSSAATFEQFELLRRHVKRVLANLGEEIVKGNVSVAPYKKKKTTSCAYCSYLSICQFDPRLKDNGYRLLDEMKEEEVWESIKG